MPSQKFAGIDPTTGYLPFCFVLCSPRNIPLKGLDKRFFSWAYQLLEAAKNTQIFLALFLTPKFNQLHEIVWRMVIFFSILYVSSILSSMKSTLCSKFKYADIWSPLFLIPGTSDLIFSNLQVGKLPNRREVLPCGIRILIWNILNAEKTTSWRGRLGPQEVLIFTSHVFK